MQADTAIGAPPDFKVNTPLKSHQSKIESLTVARELFYIQSNNGHRHYASVCAHAVCKQGWKYDGDTADSGHADGSRGGEGWKGGREGGKGGSAEAQVGNGRRQSI